MRKPTHETCGCIIKGTPRSANKQLANHLKNTRENLDAGLLYKEAMFGHDIDRLTAHLGALGKAANSKSPVRHLILSPKDHANPDREWTETEVRRMVAIMLEELGLTGQPYYVVRHVKQSATVDEERLHYHVVVLNVRDGKAIPNSWDRPKHERASRKIEKEFGLKIGRGKFTNRDPNTPRPKARLNSKGKAQQDRTGIPADLVATITTRLYREHRYEPAEFRARMEALGFRFAKGDKTPVVVLDPKGGVHALNRIVKDEDMSARDLAATVGLDPDRLPPVKEAKATLDPSKADALIEAATINKQRRRERTQSKKTERQQQRAANDNAGAKTERSADETPRETVDPKIFSKVMMDLYNDAKSGADFERLVASVGCRLAKGDKYPWGIVDPFGNFHTPRRVFRDANGKKGGDVHLKQLLGIDVDALPSLDEARRLVDPAFGPMFQRKKKPVEVEETDEAVRVETARKKKRDEQILFVKEKVARGLAAEAKAVYGKEFRDLTREQKDYIRREVEINKRAAALANQNLARELAQRGAALT